MPIRGAMRLAVLICVACCGCGGSVAGQDRAATSAHATLAVLSPVPGATVPAREHGARVRTRLDVAGRASPGARLTVSGVGCSSSCTATATADGGGAWATRLGMSLPAGAATASVAVAYEAALPADPSAAVTVVLAVPRGRRIPATAPRVQRAPALERESEGESQGQGQGDEAGTPPPAPLSPVSGVGAGPRTMVLIGDSLSVDQQPLLAAALPGWSIGASAEIGRHLAEGMGILAATDVPPGAVVAMGLFTNDDPWRTSELAAAVAESLRRAGPQGCAIWATIASPPVEGRTYDAANRLLNELAAREPRLRVVQWAQAAQQQPSLLAGDGVHPQPVGASLRAQLFAQAARSCG